jgi:hypothetical protein
MLFLLFTRVVSRVERRPSPRVSQTPYVARSLDVPRGRAVVSTGKGGKRRARAIGRAPSRSAEGASRTVTKSRFFGFFREIQLPEGAIVDQAKATFKDGVLEIKVPPEQVSRGRRLEISRRDDAKKSDADTGATNPNKKVVKRGTRKGNSFRVAGPLDPH